MSTTISNRFQILLSQKEEKEKRHISLLEVHNQTGINWRTLQSWSKNKVTRFDSSILITLCEFFDCNIEELIQFKK
jgi:putative transcriptional regulator